MLENITSWFADNYIIGLGILLITLGLILGISEFRVYSKHGSSNDQLVFWAMVFVSGVITTIFRDFIFGVLVGISVIMVIETIKLWDTPVWGKLMAATTASYLVILLGKGGQIAYDYFVKPEKTNEQIFSTAFNISFYVFIGVAFVFFGRKFILVSRLSSPQMIYLFLFGVMYGVIVFLQKQGIIFTVDENGITQSYNYLGIQGDWADRVIFANFGTFEALSIIMVFMYFISGWLLTVLFGVKEVTDPVILAKVDEVAKTMGISSKVKVGYVSAPILNAFAYGPFFDKRVAFISSDLNEFSDSDIRGIVGHELAHATKHHVIFLLLLSIAELGVKKALGFPATTLDYTFLPDDAVQNISFAAYYFFSYIFLIFLLIFVRILEGHADKVTKDAGYAEDLAKALYRLEGFYHGVASDFGISVNLLTDREYSIPEKRRFTAQAAKNLYREVLAPSRGSAFANILQSHPRTSYRIASLISDEFSPIKAAFFPYGLLGMGLRKKSIKKLNTYYKDFAAIIDKTYIEDYGPEALKEVMTFNPIKEAHEELIGKNILAFDQYDNKVYLGICTAINETDRVTSPVSAVIDDASIDLGKVIVREYNENQQYFLKNGDIITVTGYRQDKEKGVIIKGKQYGEEVEIELPKLGKPVSFISELKGREIIVFEEGVSRLRKVDDIVIGDTWQTTKITVDGKTIEGSKFIVDFPPVGVEIRKEKLKEQMRFLKFLIGKKVVLYTKDNFDVSLSGRVDDVTDETFVLTDADGKHDLDLKRLEYVIYDDHMVELITKNHISFFTKLEIKWSNRNEFNYIMT